MEVFQGKGALPEAVKANFESLECMQNKTTWMQYVRILLEIHGYQQVKFKICKENAGSLNYTKVDPEKEQAFLWGRGSPRKHAT